MLGLSFDKFIKLTNKKVMCKSVLSIKQIYGIPTRFGIYLGFTLISGIALSSRLQNNLLLLMLVFLMVIFFLSIIWSAKNLIGSNISIKKDFIFIPNKTKSIHIKISDNSKKFDIRINDHKLQTDEHYILLPYKTLKRGIHRINNLKISTKFPFNIVNCWAWLCPGDMLVAPSPIIINSKDDLYKYTNIISNWHDNDSLDHYRKYEENDSPARIDWRRYLTTDKKLTKISSNNINSDCMDLNANKMLASNKEEALKILCGVILFCEQKKIKWRLSINSLYFQSSKNEFKKTIKYLALV